MLATGFEALDLELPEPRLALRQPDRGPAGPAVDAGMAARRLVGPSLAPVAASGRSVVVIGPPKRPHLPGLRHLGIEPGNLVWIQAEAPSERLWCTEQVVKSNAAGRPEQLRRLQVLAQVCEAPVFVCRPWVAQHDPSPAPLRLLASDALRPRPR